MYDYIFSHLPYKSSFLFVDDISFLDGNKVIGHYTLKENAFFYEDHFAGNPVTPGAIITEIMAQNGLVVLGIYLMIEASGSKSLLEEDEPLMPVLTSTEISFHRIVLPGQKVTVISRKEYFRFGKLKCRVEMLDEQERLIAKGIISGIVKKIAK
ncbi:MAG TPA: hydroxymyristoyl-ACP dehydratase [Puia sp.]|nr:hydroxymyristoyl-ACP dehydratase [Puia sp.]